MSIKKEIEKEMKILLREYSRLEACSRILIERKLFIVRSKNKRQQIDENTANLLISELRGTKLCPGLFTLERKEHNYFHKLLTRIETEFMLNSQENQKGLGLVEEFLDKKENLNIIKKYQQEHEIETLEETKDQLKEKIIEFLNRQFEIVSHQIGCKSAFYDTNYQEMEALESELVKDLSFHGTLGTLVSEDNVNWNDVSKVILHAMTDVTAIIKLLEHIRSKIGKILNGKELISKRNFLKLSLGAITGLGAYKINEKFRLFHRASSYSLSKIFNTEIEKLNLKGSVCLTIDDGPSEQFKNFYYILKKNNAKGIFFFLGYKLEFILANINDKKKILESTYNELKINPKRKESYKKLRFYAGDFLANKLLGYVKKKVSFNDIKIKELIESNIDKIEDKFLEMLNIILDAIKSNTIIIGSHSYNHPQFSRISEEEALYEIKRTDYLIDRIYHMIGIKRMNKFFRFPYGDRPSLLTRNYVYNVLNSLGYKVFYWNKDTKDWKEKVFENVINNIGKISGGDIILIHERKFTVNNILEPLIKFIHSKKLKITYIS